MCEKWRNDMATQLIDLSKRIENDRTIEAEMNHEFGTDTFRICGFSFEHNGTETITLKLNGGAVHRLIDEKGVTRI